MSCQRCKIHQPTFNSIENVYEVPNDHLLFFPLELDGHDYFRRLLNYMTNHFLYSALTVSPLMGIADQFNESTSLEENISNKGTSDFRNFKLDANSEFNSVKKLLRILMSTTINEVENVANIFHPTTLLHANGHLSLTPNQLLNSVYHGDMSGVEADSLENDQTLLKAADLLLSYRNKLMGIQIPRLKVEVRTLDVAVNDQSRDQSILPESGLLFESARTFLNGVTHFMSQNYYPASFNSV